MYPCLCYEDAKDCLQELYEEELKDADSYEQNEEGYPNKRITMSDNKEKVYSYVEDEYYTEIEIQNLPFWQSKRKKKQAVTIRKNHLKEMLQKV